MCFATTDPTLKKRAFDSRLLLLLFCRPVVRLSGAGLAICGELDAARRIQAVRRRAPPISGGERRLGRLSNQLLWTLGVSTEWRPYHFVRGRGGRVEASGVRLHIKTVVVYHRHHQYYDVIDTGWLYEL